MDIQLTDAERVILATQHDILARLDIDQQKYHEAMAEALRDGHSGVYNKLFEWMSPVLSEDKQTLVFAILNLYAALKNSSRNFGPDAGIAAEDLAWPGFDGNNESDLYSFSCALARAGRYKELLGEDGVNSHGSTVDIYDRMLMRSIELNAKPPFTVDQVKQILDARRYPGE